MAFTIMDRGSFTSDGTAQKINLPASADYFVAYNLTQSATTQTTGRGIKFEWFPEYADGYALRTGKLDTADTTEVTQITSGGFTYRTSRPEPEAAKTATAITAAGPAVVTATAHGYSVGDRVRAYGTTGMLQIGGMDFTVTAVGSANAFTLGYLDASGFAAAATAGSFRRLPEDGAVEPEAQYITKITKAASAVVTLSVTHNYQVGQLVTMTVPAEMGMVEMNGLTGKVTAVNSTANTITLDIDSSGFTTFAFPTSAASEGNFSSVAPAGQRNSYDVDEVPFRTGQFVPYMYLPAGVDSPAGSSSDVIVWQAIKSEV